MENHIFYNDLIGPFLKKLSFFLTYGHFKSYQDGEGLVFPSKTTFNCFYVEIKQGLHYLITMSLLVINILFSLNVHSKLQTWF